MEKPNSPASASRRSALKVLGGAGITFLLPGKALAEDSLSFSTALGSIEGPFKKIGEALSREAKGKLGAGGKAQQYLDDYLLRGDKNGPAEIYRLAKGGDEKAHVVLGYMFDNGIGVERNSARAIDSFALGAYGEPLGSYNLGVMTLMGRGITADEDQALTHFMKAKRIPYAFTLLTLKAIERNQGAIAIKFAEKAHKLKDPYGTYLYARLLVESKSYKDGTKRMEEAASQGVPDALVSMVYLTEHGLGVNPNPGLAVGWWIVSEVLGKGATLEQAINSAERYSLNDSDYKSAQRFASKWLINRTPYIGFDYTKTITYSDLVRVR